MEVGSEEYHAAKEAAICHGCRFFSTKRDSVEVEDVSEEEIEDLVNDIADIAGWEDVGFATDWSAYDWQTKQLVRHWRLAEREVKGIRDHRMQIFLRSWLKEK